MCLSRASFAEVPELAQSISNAVTPGGGGRRAAKSELHRRTISMASPKSSFDSPLSVFALSSGIRYSENSVTGNLMGGDVYSVEKFRGTREANAWPLSRRRVESIVSQK